MIRKRLEEGIKDYDNFALCHRTPKTLEATTLTSPARARFRLSLLTVASRPVWTEVLTSQVK